MRCGFEQAIRGAIDASLRISDAGDLPMLVVEMRARGVVVTDELVDHLAFRRSREMELGLGARVRIITKVHTRNLDYKGYTHHVSTE